MSCPASQRATRRSSGSVCARYSSRNRLSDCTRLTCPTRAGHATRSTCRRHREASDIRMSLCTFGVRVLRGAAIEVARAVGAAARSEPQILPELGVVLLRQVRFPIPILLGSARALVVRRLALQHLRLLGAHLQRTPPAPPAPARCLWLRLRLQLRLWLRLCLGLRWSSAGAGVGGGRRSRSSCRYRERGGRSRCRYRPARIGRGTSTCGARDDTHVVASARSRAAQRMRHATCRWRCWRAHAVPIRVRLHVR